jgi:hypothetical protein
MGVWGGVCVACQSGALGVVLPIRIAAVFGWRLLGVVSPAGLGVVCGALDGVGSISMLATRKSTELGAAPARPGLPTLSERRNLPTASEGVWVVKSARGLDRGSDGVRSITVSVTRKSTELGAGDPAWPGWPP